MINRYELYHHGVKGMKWGVRHDYVPKGVSVRRVGTNGSKDDSEHKGIRLTDKQKKYIKIGAAVAATALVAYGGYKLSKSGALDKYVQRGKSLLGNTIPKPQSSKKASISDAIKNINPTKSKTNCRACSIASALNLKGIKAEALDVKGGSLSDAVKSCFKGARVSEMYEPSKQRMDSYILKKFGEGASGVADATFKTPRGDFFHAFTWTVKDGKVNYIDSQSGLADCSRYFDFLNPDGEAHISRLDNLEIDYEGLSKFVKIRK